MTALLNIPLAAICTGVLVKLAMAKKNEHLWARLGIDQLRDTLVTLESDVETSPGKESETISLVACGGVAFVEKKCKRKGAATAKGLRSYTLTKNTTVHLGTDGTNPQNRSVILKDADDDPNQFEFSVGPEKEELNRWVAAIRTAIRGLPRYSHALRAAVEASSARLLHMNSRRFLLAADNAALARLQTYSVSLLEHAKRQAEAVKPEDERLSDESIKTLSKSGKVFRYDDISFEQKIRPLMMVDSDLIVEEEEDEGGRRLKSCCASGSSILQS